jgi:hypothetical protein
MKHSTIPVICSIALASISTAGLGHWWSVRELIAIAHHELPILTIPHPYPDDTNSKISIIQPSTPKTLIVNSPKEIDPTVTTQAQKEFFESLVKEVQTLHGENSKLVDQMAETNRSIMQLEFRVDTNSESFRPMPVSEESSDATSLSDHGDRGVLPPRALPVHSLTN